MGGLPLALAHAGSYIHGTTTSVKDYIRHYEQTWEKLHDNNTTRLKDYPRSILSTYTISYEYVQQKDLSTANLLNLFAYLDHSDLWYSLFTPLEEENGSFIPLQVMKKLLPAWFLCSIETEYAFTQKIQILLDCSLIETRYEFSSYTIHPIVHDWCFYLNLASNDEIAVLAVLVIGSACEFTNSPTRWLYRKRLADHCSHVCSWIGKTPQNLKKSKKLQVMFCLSCVAIGAFLYQQEKLKEAEEMYLRALTACEKEWGLEHYITGTVNFLGVLYEDQNKLKEAEAMHKQALEYCMRMVGSDHEAKFFIYSRLGNLYRRQGKMKEADATLQGALKGREKLLGSEHTSTLMTVKHLGYLYEHQVKYNEAEEMYLRLLTGFKKISGSYLNELDTMNKLGDVYAKQGKINEAEEIYLRALTEAEKNCGSDYTITPYTAIKLGGLYVKQGRTNKAEKMYLRALTSYEKTWGPDHRMSLLAIFGLAINVLHGCAELIKFRDSSFSTLFSISHHHIQII